MVNRAIIVGHLGHAPRIREEPGKTPFVSFSVATSEKWKDQQGQRHERTDWHDVVAWGERWAAVAKLMRKGSKVYVEGQMQKRKYKGKDGVERVVCEVVLSGFHSDIQLLDKAPSDRAPEPGGPEAYGAQRDPYSGHPEAPLGGDFDGFDSF